MIYCKRFLTLLLFLTAVELHLSRLIGTVSHPVNWIFFLRLHWQLEVEKDFTYVS